MGTRWTRPVEETASIAGGYMLLRSHAILSLWQAYRQGAIRLVDVRVALAACELTHRQRQASSRSRPQLAGARPRSVVIQPADVLRLTRSSCPRKARMSFKRLANAGVPVDGLLSRSKSELPRPPDGIRDIADRPVPVPRRLARWLAREGTSSGIAVSIAHLLRGSYTRGGRVRLGGTCSAAWISATFAIDERTAKAGRCGLVARGWLVPEKSPVWHRQRFGSTFTINPRWNIFGESDHMAERSAQPASGSASLVRGSPPRSTSGVPGIPPPRKNKYPPLRGSENQDRISGVSQPSRQPSLTNIVPEDLESPARMLALFRDIRRRQLISDSEADKLRFFTTIQHAKRQGRRPCALFAVLARRRCWHFGTNTDEDLARGAITAAGGQSEPTTHMAAQLPQARGAPTRPANPTRRQGTRLSSTSGFATAGEVLAAVIPGIAIPSELALHHRNARAY